MSITQAELFTRCGQFLCGSGPKWKEQFAGLLQVQTNTVDNMSKGTSRIPQTMWMELGRFVQDRADQSGALIQAIFAVAHPGMQGQGDFRRAVLTNNRHDQGNGFLADPSDATNAESTFSAYQLHLRNGPRGS